MNQLSKNMRHALDSIRGMPSGHQDLLAAEMLDRAKVLTEPPDGLLPGERAALEAAMEKAKRREFAPEATVAAMYAKHGQ